MDWADFHCTGTVESAVVIAGLSQGACDDSDICLLSSPEVRGLIPMTVEERNGRPVLLASNARQPARRQFPGRQCSRSWLAMTSDEAPPSMQPWPARSEGSLMQTVGQVM